LVWLCFLNLSIEGVQMAIRITDVEMLLRPTRRSSPARFTRHAAADGSGAGSSPLTKSRLFATSGSPSHLPMSAS
jgi:hypothetical protein